LLVRESVVPSSEFHVLFLNLLVEYLEMEEVEVALQYLRVTDWVKVLR
jgi:hypothetical protein